MPGTAAPSQTLSRVFYNHSCFFVLMFAVWKGEGILMEDQSFHPYIPADRVAPEMTAVSVLLGAVLAIVFGAANAYLGLRVGMTISASIPAAVLSMGLTRFILKRDSILENNSLRRRRMVPWLTLTMMRL